MEIYSNNEQRSDRLSQSAVLPYAKIFLWFGLGILLCGLVGFGLPYLLDFSGASSTTYMVATIISGIMVLPLSLIISFKSFNPNSAAVPVCYTLYSIAFGVLISSALSFAGLEASLYAFLATGGIMALMGVMGILVGPRMNKIMMFALTLAFGALVISLINFFFFNETLYWVTTFVMFGCVMLFTAFDFYHINRLVYNSTAINRNLAIYCAYILFSDFIYIFVRILLLVSSFARNNN